MANLEIVLGHSGRDDNLNTNSGGYFESLCQIAAWLLGLNPYMYPGFTLKTSTFPQECHLMVPLMTKWSNTWRANLNSTRRKWSLFWKWTRCSDGHWAPDPVTSIASTIPFAFQGLHGCSSSFSSVFYIWRQRASISRPSEYRFLRAITKVNGRPCNGHFLSHAVLAPRKWVFLDALHRTNHLKKQFFEGDPWGGPPLQIFVA